MSAAEVSLADTFPWIVKPWGHQRDAWERAVPMRDYAFFFEMGCGKTATSLNVLRYLYAAKKRVMRTLIIAPVAVLENWRREFGVHTKSQQYVTVLKGTAKKKMDLLKANKGIVVVNFDVLKSQDLWQALYDWHPEIVLVDESQRIKNYKAKRTKAVIQLGHNAAHRYILSGSPILNSPMDVFSQFHFLDKGETFGENFFAFRARYFEDKNAGMPSHKYYPDWKPRPTTAEDFNRLIYQKASRVTKKDALDLPDLVREEIPVSLGKDQATMYEAMRQELIAYLGDKACVARIALTKALRLQQIVSGFFVEDGTGAVTRYKENPRLEALEELVEQIVTDGEHQLLIWASFRENYDVIGELLDKAKIPWCQVVGGMTEKKRQGAIDDFQSGKCRVMLANQKAGGVGLNLTAASYSVYFSKGYSLEDDLQSESRNHRGGSEIHDKITRIDLVATGTIDEKITLALARKTQVAEDILQIRELLA